MTIHKEGHSILLTLALFLAVVNLSLRWVAPEVMTPVMVVSAILFFMVLRYLITEKFY